jgi:hypothetical protein
MVGKWKVLQEGNAQTTDTLLVKKDENWTWSLALPDEGHW